MYPVIFTFPDWFPIIGGHALHFYGLMIAVGFLLALVYIRREAHRIGIEAKLVEDLFFYLIVSGIVGARILFFVNSSKLTLDDPLAFFRVWEGGLVFQGGVLACIVVTVWYARKINISFFRIADVFAPALALGHGLGRIGCLFAGCCYGKPAPDSFPFSIIFPLHEHGGIAPSGVPLYPTQIFEAVGEFLIFYILLRYRFKKTFEGGVVLLYFILYSILRSTVEVFRGDHVRGFVIEPYLSRGQGISLIMIVVSLVLWFYRKKNYPLREA